MLVELDLPAPYDPPKEFARMNRLVPRHICLLVGLLVLVPCLCVGAQTPILEEPNYTPTLMFDIAVIRQAAPPSKEMVTSRAQFDIAVIRQAAPPDANFHVAVSSLPHSSRFEATNLPIKTLLQIAYGFDAPVAGAPEWTANSFYNILAYSDADADAKLAKLTDNEVRLEKRHAIRALLADRLGLKTHFETRNSAIYNLVVAKGGVKMKATPQPPAGEAPGPPPPANVQTHASRHGLEFDGTNASMRAICGALGAMVEEPVIDTTGLTGSYDYTLQFGREWSERDPDSWPSIFTAVQEQLGLRLEAEHEAIPNLVIDHITKPTEN